MSERAAITLDCTPDRHGWKLRVEVNDGRSATIHEVVLSVPELRRYGDRETSPDRLVTASFRFLLERESKESIMRSFRLSDIERYFPEFPRIIGTYLAAEP